MVGIDEVGRGSWAGPLLVVAARAVLELPDGLTDSKLLSRAQREKMHTKLIKVCEFGEGWVNVDEIDHNGLASALRLGIARALESLKVFSSEQIILDGSVNYVSKLFTNASCLVDADRKIPIVSAASVYAKVTRDRFMRELSLKHPNYGFQNHVGYGTKAHRQSLTEFGILQGIHRTTFSPIKNLQGRSL